MSGSEPPRICFIGFGEAGQAIAAGLRDTGGAISAWDILFPTDAGAKLRQPGEAAGVRIATSAAEAVGGAEIIISAVTAASSLEAAQSVKPHLGGKPFFLDINSVSPGRKQEAARLLGDGARYVDVAVMAPVHPARHRTPMLLAGPHAEDIEPILARLGMSVAVAALEVGGAAAIKMVRSVMIKGLEALTYECFIAAARAGVEEQVIATLSQTFPTLDWSKMIEYNFERMARHGARRAAEMEEVAGTLRELGVEPLMVEATVKRQREMGELGKQSRVQSTIRSGRSAILNAVSAASRDRH